MSCRAALAVLALGALSGCDATLGGAGDDPQDAALGSVSTPAASPPGTAASGTTPAGAHVRLAIAGEQIASGTPGTSSSTFVWPPIVDSHVHLAFSPVGDALAAHGIGAVVDLAAPETTLAAADRPVLVVGSGPMVTSPGGYPLDSWGADGYGIGCADAACVRGAIDRLAAAGARVIKLPVDRGGLDPALVPIAVAHAHGKEMKVAVHALTDAAAARAAAAGADVLAHTPVEPLAPSTVETWRGRAVISTLAAFGGAPATVDNLRRLRAAGVTVLYGTDLGNLRVDGPSRDEIALLRQAGLDDAAITAAMTTTPLAYWGIPLDLRAGSEATFLVLARDPRVDVAELLAPAAVFSRGRPMR